MICSYPPNRRLRHCSILTFCLPIFLAALAGCGVSPPVISVNSPHANRRFLETFSQAYTSKDASGDVRVVLLHDPADDLAQGAPGEPLIPASVAPVRHVLEIRLLWRPVQGAKPDSPAATNASLHWYVLGARTAEGGSMIHYAGTAFVAAVPDGPGAEITISNGELHRVDLRGSIVDPLQAFSISGKFDAIADDTRLHQIQDDVKTAVAEIQSQDAPPRAPTGP